MPKIEQSESQIKVTLTNGPEVFTAADPLEATNQLAASLDENKKYINELKAENARLKAPPATTQPPADGDKAAFRNYLLEEHAQALGYASAQEYKAELEKVKTTVDRVGSKDVAADFHQINPDFPDTPEAVEKLSKKIDDMGWKFDIQSMTAAHALLIREHGADESKGYAALTPEQINATWANNMAQASRQTPPPMLRTNNPELSAQNQNDPWNMNMQDLRKAAIAQELARNAG